MKYKNLILLSAAFAGSASLVTAANANSTSFGDDIESGIKKVWDHATFYKNEDNDFIQKIAFTGRLQYDYAYFDNEESSHHEENEWRRARAGFKVDFLNALQAHVEMDMDFNDHDPIYNRLTDAYIAYKTDGGTKFKVGKQSAGFTLDGATSSKKLYRAERSLIGANIWFGTEYFVGATAAGKHDNWSWKGGLFSNTNRQEFDNTFDASYFVLASLGYDFADALDTDKALLRLDYVYQDEPSESEEEYTHGRDNLENVVSLSFQYDNGKRHLHTDVAYADEVDGNVVFAIQIMPFYDLTERFQVVGSYTYIENDEGGIRLSRYSRRTPVVGRVEEANEFYLGLNTYLYGHKVKWQNGIEYTTTDDDQYEGLGFTSAVRISW